MYPISVSLSFYTIRICLFFKFAGFVYLLASTHVVIKLLCISEEGGKSPIKNLSLLQHVVVMETV